MALTTYIDLH